MDSDDNLDCFESESVRKVFLYLVANPDILDELGYSLSPKGQKLVELLTEGWNFDEALAIVRTMTWEKNT